MNSELTTMQTADLTAEEMASTISDFSKESFAALSERREREYAASIAPLDEELAALASELAEIEAQSRGVLERLAAAERVKRFEADQLVVAGKSEEAQAKLAELEEVKAAPAKIEERRGEIAARVEEIESEKKTALRRGGEVFRDASFTLIRGGETALASILDGTRYSLNNLETQLGTTLYQPGQLTAHERSDEWNTLHRLYGGRVR